MEWQARSYRTDKIFLSYTSRRPKKLHSAKLQKIYTCIARNGFGGKPLLSALHLLPGCARQSLVSPPEPWALRAFPPSISLALAGQRILHYAFIWKETRVCIPQANRTESDNPSFQKVTSLSKPHDKFHSITFYQILNAWKKKPQAKPLNGCVPVLKVFYHHAVNKDKAFFC